MGSPLHLGFSRMAVRQAKNPSRIGRKKAAVISRLVVVRKKATPLAHRIASKKAFGYETMPNKSLPGLIDDGFEGCSFFSADQQKNICRLTEGCSPRSAIYR